MQKSLTKFLILAFILTTALSVNYLFAVWSGPTQAPPGGNTSMPIHVGATNQVKDGGLSLNGLSVFGGGYFQGNVGIGVVVPTEKLDVTGSIKASGTVCDSNGCIGSSNGGVPTGTISSYGGTSAPTGWLLTDGSAVSRATYSDLFNVIGTTYGAGDGSTTFNLPDLRGRFPLGQDDMSGTNANRVQNPQADILGGNAGEETHTLTVAEMPAHNHRARKAWGGASAGTREVFRVTNNTGNSAFEQWTSNGIENTGSGNAHNNMPPYLSLNYIIKT